MGGRSLRRLRCLNCREYPLSVCLISLLGLQFRPSYWYCPLTFRCLFPLIVHCTRVPPVASSSSVRFRGTLLVLLFLSALSLITLVFHCALEPPSRLSLILCSRTSFPSVINIALSTDADADCDGSISTDPSPDTDTDTRSRPRSPRLPLSPPSPLSRPLPPSSHYRTFPIPLISQFCTEAHVFSV